MTFMQSGRTLAPALAALAALALGACSQARMETTGQPAAPTVTEGNVGAIVRTSNNAEIEQSQLALSKSQNRAVREYAQMMITEHNAANQQLDQVLGRIGVTPAPDQTTRQLMTNSARTMEALQARSGADFDRTYMQTQVAMHRWTLTALDQSLIPAARSNELESLLMQTRAKVAMHLQRAQQIHSQLGGM